MWFSTSDSWVGTFPISCKSPARLAIFGLNPNSAAIIPHNLATSLSAVTDFARKKNDISYVHRLY